MINRRVRAQLAGFRERQGASLDLAGRPRTDPLRRGCGRFPGRGHCLQGRDAEGGSRPRPDRGPAGDRYCWEPVEEFVGAVSRADGTPALPIGCREVN